MKQVTIPAQWLQELIALCGPEDHELRERVMKSAAPAPADALATATAPTEPFGYFKAEPFGWTDCGPDDEGAVALYEKPQAMLATGGDDAAPETPEDDQAAEHYVSDCDSSGTQYHGPSYERGFLSGRTAGKDEATGGQAQADARDAERWIPVTERLPDLGQEVLAGYAYQDTWLKGDPWIFSMGVCNMYEYPNDPCFPQGKRWKTHGCSHSAISHWMPLPAPPEIDRAAIAAAKGE